MLRQDAGCDRADTPTTHVAAAQALDSSYAVEGQLPVRGCLHIQKCDDEELKAEFVVLKIQELIENGHPDVEDGVKAESVGILGRNKFVFQEVEKKLVECGMAYHKKVSAAGYESESDVMEEFELALRVLRNPLDRLHLGMLATSWKTEARALCT